MPRGHTGIQDIIQHVAYDTGYLITGVNISLRDDGWLLVVKVKSKKSGHLVSFIHSESIDGCLDFLWNAVTTEGTVLKWREDKWKGG